MAKNYKNNIIESTMLQLQKAGLSVFPCGDDKKALYGIKWGDYQKKIPTHKEIYNWTEDFKAEHLALICGKISGNVLCIDFDNHNKNASDIFNDYMEILKSHPTLNKYKFFIEQSPSGGYHLIFKTLGTITGSEKLAKEFHKQPGKIGMKNNLDKVVATIETRGESSYVVCAPSKGYKCIEGDLTKLPVVNSDEQDYILELAKSFNRELGKKPDARAKEALGIKAHYNNSDNAEAHINEMLLSAGWSEAGRNEKTISLKRPGETTSKSSGTIYIDSDKIMFHCFSSNAEPFEGGQSYNRFQVYAIIYCYS